MIRCECGGITRVNETRSTRSEHQTIVRVRICNTCSLRFNTVEAPVNAPASPLVGLPRPAYLATRPARVTVEKVPSLNNTAGMKARADARRRLEELRDMEEEDDGSMSMDELRSELGY